VNPLTEPAVSTLRGVFHHVLPEVVLLGMACVLFLASTLRANRHTLGGLALAGLLAAALVAVFVPAPVVGAPSVSPVVHDGLADWTRFLALGGVALLVLLAWNAVPDRFAGEYHACLLIAAAGVALAGAANELVTLFLALELVSIPSYVLLYLPRPTRAAQEAAVKYFLLSIGSSAVMLFGFSYLYGVTGTTNLTAMLDAFSRVVEAGRPAVEVKVPPLAAVAAVLVVAGIGFKITAVPFHFYAPDVYQGAPTVAAAALAFLPKAAGFVALIRVFGLASAGAQPAVAAWADQLQLLFWVLAAVTMTVGNVMALLQDNVKRLLAWSGVAHSGYMLIGLAVTVRLLGDPSAGPQADPLAGTEAALFYLIAYTAMTVGAFAVLQLVSTPERPVETVDDLAGLRNSHPVVALLMAVCLFSLIGLPLTAGFTGKLLLFVGAVRVPASYGLYQWLAVIAALNAAVGAYYYLRIAGVMFLREAITPLKAPRTVPAYAALVVCAAVTLGLGVYSGRLWRITDPAFGTPAASASVSEAPGVAAR
jgi:NADH-quinone oxidoreductase subunit N